MTLKLNIHDNSFAHQSHSVFGRTSNVVEWKRDGTGDPRVTFYTNENCFRELSSNAINIAWLLESQGIIPHVYHEFPKVADKFDVILTHSSELLKLPNAMWSRAGGIWVGTDAGGGKVKIYPKSDLISIVCSLKNMCPLHLFRYEIAKEYYHQGLDSSKVCKVSTFGLDCWVPIIESLDKFAFSIIVENFIDDSFYTEKLLNCFAAGTIPIYFGARNIDLFFNIDGIIRFSSKEELYYIVNRLTMDDYYNRMDAVKDNFNRVQEYLPTIEDDIIHKLDVMNSLG